MKDKISVIVTLYNRLEYARNMILALQQQTKQIDELIFADDGSSEKLMEYIEDLLVDCNFKIKHVYQDDIGFRLARSRYRSFICRLKLSGSSQGVVGDGQMRNKFLNCFFVHLPFSLFNSNHRFQLRRRHRITFIVKAISNDLGIILFAICLVIIQSRICAVNLGLLIIVRRVVF